MRNTYGFFLAISFIVFTFFGHSDASVESQVLRTYKLEKTPLDVAVSFSGKWIFVLTDKGEIQIYSGDGRLNDTLSVGKSIDGIQVSPRDDIIFLTSRKNKTFQILALDYIQNIDISGLPYKGPADAPVVVAVFDDYQ